MNIEMTTLGWIAVGITLAALTITVIAFILMRLLVSLKQSSQTTTATAQAPSTTRSQSTPPSQTTAPQKGSVPGWAKWLLVASGVLSLIVLAVLAHHWWTGEPEDKPRETGAARRHSGVPAEVALPIICGFESSDAAGRVWHYKNGDPKQGLNISKTNDIGGCQINAPLHEKRAKEEYQLDIRTPEGNMEYAKILYQEQGVQPWVGKPGQTTIHKWGPILAELQGLRTYKIQLVAPVGKFGPEYRVIGYEVWWGESSGVFVVRNDQGLEARFNPKENLLENLPYLHKGEKRGFSRTLQFKSLSDKPEKVLLELTRQ